MKRVSRFEEHLLRLLHSILLRPAAPLPEARLQRPPCLSGDAITLVKDALGKGCVLLLTRLGGWRRERHLRDEKIVEGRLWERTPPERLGLRFSPVSLDFLLWATAKKPDEAAKTWQAAGEATSGDLVLLFLAFDLLRTAGLTAGVIRTPPADTHGLLRLAYPDEYAKADNVGPPDFRPWVGGDGGAIVEGLQPMLAERWVSMELEKGQIANWQAMRALGAAQEQALDGFLHAVEEAGRLDLARFLLTAAARLLTPTATPALWVGGLTARTAPRLQDRAETYRGALALLLRLPRLQQWERRARAVGYFDDGYPAAQLWKADWERYQGDVLAERAQAVIRHLDPMRQTEG